MHKSLFLDRDGTLIHNIPYLADPDQVQLIEGAQAALKRALGLGYRLFLFSNQSAVGRGYFGIETVYAVNARMLELIGLGEIFTEACLATEAPSTTPIYRKPSPRFIHEMLAKYQLDPQHTYLLGDRLCDVQAALQGGVQAVFLEKHSVVDTSEKHAIQALAPIICPDFYTFTKDFL